MTTKTTSKTDRQMQAATERIAREILGRTTLATQNSSADFAEQAVWQIKEALEAAYVAGHCAGWQQGRTAQTKS
jgi:hypothetical protein